MLDKVEILRRELADSKYKMSKADLNRLTQVHIDIAKIVFGSGIVEWKGSYNFYESVDHALKDSCRIVFGAHGPYVEFRPEHLAMEMEIPEEHKWRTKSSAGVKYLHYQPVGREEKIYVQIYPVSYADYKVGFCYMDLYSLMPELEASREIREHIQGMSKDDLLELMEEADDMPWPEGDILLPDKSGAWKPAHQINWAPLTRIEE